MSKKPKLPTLKEVRRKASVDAFGNELSPVFKKDFAVNPYGHTIAINGLKSSFFDPTLQLVENQTTWDVVKNGTANFAKKLVGSAAHIIGAGYDFSGQTDSVSSFLKGTDEALTQIGSQQEELGNWLMTWGKEVMESADIKNPLYYLEDERFGSGAYFVKTATDGFGQALGMGIPMILEGLLVSYITGGSALPLEIAKARKLISGLSTLKNIKKGAKLKDVWNKSKKAIDFISKSKIARTTGTTAAIRNRLSESYIEAIDTGEALRQKIELEMPNISEEEKNLMIGKAMQGTYNANLPMVAMDIIQFNLLTGGLAIGKNVIKNSFLRGGANVLMQAGTEGLEEFYQAGAQKYGEAKGLGKDSSLSSIVSKTWNDPTSWDAFLSGAFGGGGMQLLQGGTKKMVNWIDGNSKNKYYQRSRDSFLQTLQKDNLEKIIDAQTEIDANGVLNDEAKQWNLLNTISQNKALEALHLDSVAESLGNEKTNVDSYMQYIDDIANLESENEDLVNIAQKLRKDFDAIKKIYDKNKDNLLLKDKHSILGSITSLEFKRNSIRDVIEKSKLNITDNLDEVSKEKYNNLNQNTKDYLNLLAQLEHWRNSLKGLKSKRQSKGLNVKESIELQAQAFKVQDLKFRLKNFRESNKDIDLDLANEITDISSFGKNISTIDILEKIEKEATDRLNKYKSAEGLKEFEKDVINKDIQDADNEESLKDIEDKISKSDLNESVKKDLKTKLDKKRAKVSANNKAPVTPEDIPKTKPNSKKKKDDKPSGFGTKETKEDLDKDDAGQENLEKQRSDIKIPKLTTVKVDLSSLSIAELKNVAKQLRQKAVNARQAEKEGKPVIGGSVSVENDYQAIKKYIKELEALENQTQTAEQQEESKQKDTTEETDVPEELKGPMEQFNVIEKDLKEVTDDIDRRNAAFENLNFNEGEDPMDFMKQFTDTKQSISRNVDFKLGNSFDNWLLKSFVDQFSLHYRIDQNVEKSIVGAVSDIATTLYFTRKQDKSALPSSILIAISKIEKALSDNKIAKVMEAGVFKELGLEIRVDVDSNFFNSGRKSEVSYRTFEHIDVIEQTMDNQASIVDNFLEFLSDVGDSENIQKNTVKQGKNIKSREPSETIEHNFSYSVDPLFKYVSQFVTFNFEKEDADKSINIDGKLYDYVSSRLGKNNEKFWEFSDPSGNIEVFSFKDLQGLGYYTVDHQAMKDNPLDLKDTPTNFATSMLINNPDKLIAGKRYSLKPIGGKVTVYDKDGKTVKNIEQDSADFAEEGNIGIYDGDELIGYVPGVSKAKYLLGKSDDYIEKLIRERANVLSNPNGYDVEITKVDQGSNRMFKMSKRPEDLNNLLPLNDLPEGYEVVTLKVKNNDFEFRIKGNNYQVSTYTDFNSKDIKLYHGQKVVLAPVYSKMSKHGTVAKQWKIIPLANQNSSIRTNPEVTNQIIDNFISVVLHSVRKNAIGDINQDVQDNVSGKLRQMLFYTLKGTTLTRKSPLENTDLFSLTSESKIKKAIEKARDNGSFRKYVSEKVKSGENYPFIFTKSGSDGSGNTIIFGYVSSNNVEVTRLSLGFNKDGDMDAILKDAYDKVNKLSEFLKDGVYNGKPLAIENVEFKENVLDRKNYEVQQMSLNTPKINSETQIQLGAETTNYNDTLNQISFINEFGVPIHNEGQFLYTKSTEQPIISFEFVKKDSAKKTKPEKQQDLSPTDKLTLDMLDETNVKESENIDNFQSNEKKNAVNEYLKDPEFVKLLNSLKGNTTNRTITTQLALKMWKAKNGTNTKMSIRPNPSFIEKHEVYEKELSNIEGLTPQEENILIDHINKILFYKIEDLIGLEDEQLKSEMAAVMQSVRNDLEGIIEADSNEKQQLIDQVEKEFEGHQDIIDELTSSIRQKEKYNKRLVSDDETFRKLFLQSFNNFAVRNEQILDSLMNERNYTQSNRNSDVKAMLDSNTRLFFGRIPKTDRAGNIIRGFLSLPLYYSANDVYNRFLNLMNEPVKINNSKEAVLERLEQHRSKPYVKELIKRFKDLDRDESDRIFNTILYNLRGKTGHKFLQVSEVSKKMEMQFMDSDSNAAKFTIMRNFNENAKLKGFIKLVANSYVWDRKAIQSYLDEYSKEIESIYEGNYNIEDKVAYLDLLLNFVGIELDENVLGEIQRRAENNEPVFSYTSRVNGKDTVYEFSLDDMLSESDTSFFGYLNKSFRNIVENEEILPTTDNLYLNDSINVRSPLNALIELEFQYSNISYVSDSIYEAGKTIWAFSMSDYVTNQIKEVKSADQDHVMLKDVYSRYSPLFKFIANSENYKSALNRIEYSIIGQQAIKYADKTNDIKFTNLSARDRQIIKFAAYKDKKSQENLSSIDGWQMIMMYHFLPTISDKQQQSIIYMPTYSVENYAAYVNKNGKLIDIDGKNKLAELYFEVFVKPQISRILSNHNAKLKNQNLYDKAVDKFIETPFLNKVKISNANGESLLLPYIKEIFSKYMEDGDTVEQAIEKVFNGSTNNDGSVDTSVYDLIKDAIVEDIEKDGAEQLREWKDSGLEKDRYVQANTSAKEAVLYNLQDNINNQNVISSLIGDPAEFYKEKDSSFFNNKGLPLENKDFNRFGEKNVATEFFKRMAMIIAPGNELAGSENITVYQMYLEDVKVVGSDLVQILELDDKYKGKIPENHKKFLRDRASSPYSKDEYNTVIKELKNAYPEYSSYFDIEKTDAQEYVTAPSYFEILYRQGRLTRSERDLAVSEYLEKGDKFILSNLNAKLKNKIRPIPLKFVTTGRQFTPLSNNSNFENSSFSRINYIKSSTMPLFPEFTSGKDINNLRTKLENIEKHHAKQAGMSSLDPNVLVKASYSTANKVGDILSPVSIHTKMTSQQLLNGGFVRKINGSSLRIQQDVPYKKKARVILGTQIVNMILGDFATKNDEVAPFVDEYNSLVSLLLDHYNTELEDKLFDENGDVDVQKAFDFLREQAAAGSITLSPQDAEMLDKLEGDYPAIPFLLSPNSQKIEQLLLSAVKNTIGKIKVPGYSFVLGTSAGLKARTDVNLSSKQRDGIIYTDRYDFKLNRLKENQVFLRSKMTDQDGNIIDLLKYTTKNKDGKYILDTSKIDSELLELFSYRIPTGGYTSMQNIEIAGFLPDSNEDQIIVSENAQVQIGEDYDIDKRNVLMYNTTIVDGKIVKDNAETHSLKDIENRLLDTFKNISKTEYVQKRMKKELSIAVSQNTTDAIAEKLPSDNYNWKLFSNFSYEKSLKTNMDGADAIGTFANYNKMYHIASQLSSSPRMMNMQYLFDGKENYSFTGVNNGQMLDGKSSLAQVLEEVLNAALDNAKHNILGKANVNKYTINVFSFLTMNGHWLGKTKDDKELAIPYLFTAQPIIKRYVELKSAYESETKVYDPDQERKILQALDDEFPNNNVENNFNFKTDDLYKQLSNPTNSFQNNVLDLFLQLKENVESILPVHSFFGIQSKGTGVSIASAHVLSQRVSTLGARDYVIARYGIPGIIGSQGFVTNNTPSSKIGKNMLGTVLNNLDSIFHVRKLMGELDTSLYLDKQPKNLEKYHEAINSLKHFMYGNKDLGLINEKPAQLRKELTFGDTSLAKRIYNFKNGITNGVKDVSLEMLSKDYKLITLLSPKFGKVNDKKVQIEPDRVTYKNTQGENWDELEKYNTIKQLIVDNLEIDDNYTTRDLGYDLIKYSVLIGIDNRPTSFEKYIPLTALIESGYGKNSAFKIRRGGNWYRDYIHELVYHNPKLAPNLESAFDLVEKHGDNYVVRGYVYGAKPKNNGQSYPKYAHFRGKLYKNTYGTTYEPVPYRNSGKKSNIKILDNPRWGELTLPQSKKKVVTKSKDSGLSTSKVYTLSQVLKSIKPESLSNNESIKKQYGFLKDYLERYPNEYLRIDFSNEKFQSKIDNNSISIGKNYVNNTDDVIHEIYKEYVHFITQKGIARYEQIKDKNYEELNDVDKVIYRSVKTLNNNYDKVVEELSKSKDERDKIVMYYHNLLKSQEGDQYENFARLVNTEKDLYEDKYIRDMVYALTNTDEFVEIFLHSEQVISRFKDTEGSKSGIVGKISKFFNNIKNAINRIVKTYLPNSKAGSVVDLVHRSAIGLAEIPIQYPKENKNFTDNLGDNDTKDKPSGFKSKEKFSTNRYENKVNYTLKAIDILQSDKAKQVFKKGKKNGWDLKKILTELQVPKQQKQIILDKYKDKVSEQEFIKSIFPDTKVKQIVYHGSPNKFDKFSKEKLGENTGSESAKKAFFFADNPLTSLTYTYKNWGLEDNLEVFSIISYLTTKFTVKSSKEDILNDKDVSILSPNEAILNAKNLINDFNYQQSVSFNISEDVSINFDKDYSNKTEGKFTIHTFGEGEENFFGIKEKEEIITKEEFEKLLPKAKEYLSKQKSNLNIYSVIINSKNPLVKDDKNKRWKTGDEFAETFDSRMIEARKKNKDSVIINNTADPIENSNIFTVFEPEQIHILTEEEQAKIYNEDNLREEIITSLLADNSFVVDVLNKLYNVKEVTDEYVNTWNEISIESDTSKNIRFSIRPFSPNGNRIETDDVTGIEFNVDNVRGDLYNKLVKETYDYKENNAAKKKLSELNSKYGEKIFTLQRHPRYRGSSKLDINDRVFEKLARDISDRVTTKANLAEAQLLEYVEKYTLGFDKDGSNTSYLSYSDEVVDRIKECYG